MGKKLEIEYFIQPQSKLDLGLTEVWNYRELFYFFTWRDIKIKYKQTVLGFLWAIIQPLIMVAVFSLFFSKTLSIQTGNLPYPLFVLTGLLFWNLFSNGVNNASNSMISNASIIKKIYFPRMIIPMSSVLVATFDFFITLIVFLSMCFYYDQAITIGLVLNIFICSIIVVICSFGLGTFLAALTVKYRDFRYVIPFGIQAFMFLTPIFYPTTMVTNKIALFLLNLNPVGLAIQSFRSTLYGESNFNYLIPATAISILLLIIGLVYFKKTESYFADIA